MFAAPENMDVVAFYGAASETVRGCRGIEGMNFDWCHIPSNKKFKGGFSECSSTVAFAKVFGHFRPIPSGERANDFCLPSNHGARFFRLVKVIEIIINLRDQSLIYRGRDADMFK